MEQKRKGKIGARVFLTQRSLQLPEGFDVVGFGQENGVPYIDVKGSFDEKLMNQKKVELHQWLAQFENSK
jgi:hypothetical protein